MKTRSNPPKRRSSAKPLTSAALLAAKLKSSGLDARDAKKLGITALRAADVVRLDRTFKPYPAARLSYFDLRGRPTKFYRLRYLGELNGFDALAKKAPRYVQAPGTTIEAYFPPLLDWAELAADPTRAVFITEGELKAACATKLGFPTIGLGGVWSWRSAKTRTGFLPVLADEFAWHERLVYLTFDSDLATNPQVMRAAVALATELVARGAAPAIVRLPALDDVPKTGLDDFLVARGAAAFSELVETAEPFSAATELWRLNSEVVYIRDPGLVVVTADGRKLAPRAFKEHAFSNRHYFETKFDAAGNTKLVKKPLAAAWLEWELRAELRKLTYAPGEPRETPDGDYNFWPGWGVEPARGDVGPWVELLDFLFGADRTARDWFERWLAYPLRYPGTKLYTAAVLWGVGQGTGKSLVGYTLMRIYGRNATEITDQHLQAPFNEWAENKQFVMGDDVTSGELKRAVADRLKSMITQQQLRLNPKYVPSYVVPDCVNYYFTANHPDAFFLDDQDRRFFIHEAPAEPQPREFYRAYDAWLKSTGPAALFDHLLRLDLAGFDPQGPALATAAKAAMILDGKSDVAAFVARLKETPDAVLRFGSEPLRPDVYTNDQLLALYDPDGVKRVTANGLGRELKKAGFRQVAGGKTVVTPKGPQRLYAVRNVDRWLAAKPADVTAHLKATRGGGDEKPKKF